MVLLFSILFLFSVFSANAQVYINEIFPAPAQSKSEWIEIYNPNENDISLPGLIITNRNSSFKLERNINLLPNSFFALLSDTVGFSDNLTCPFLVINLPTLHNDWDAITIRTLDSVLIDSIYYDFRWGKKDFSLERYDWSIPAVSKENWNVSSDVSGHTLCRKNSKTIKDIQLEDELQIDNGICRLLLKNFGRKNIENLQIEITVSFSFGEFDTIFSIGSWKQNKLQRGDSLHLQFSIDSVLKTLEYSFLNKIDYFIGFDSMDTRVSRQKSLRLNLPKPFKGLLINEILFDVYTGCGEFLELVNISSRDMNLSKWKLRNSSGKMLSFPNDDSFKIKAGKYCAIVWDSSFFNCFEGKKGDSNVIYVEAPFVLRNSGDKIVLSDPIGIVHDSVNFLPQWHKGKMTSFKQKSLEKMIESKSSNDSTNWYTCVDKRGATPGELNSVSIQKEESIWVDIEPNPFVPGKIENPVCKISYRLPFVQSRINAKIFSLDGILVLELENNTTSPSSGIIEWDGMMQSGKKIEPGGYIFVIEAIDIQTGKVIKEIKSLAVGW
jgi:hypothetical protein